MTETESSNISDTGLYIILYSKSLSTPSISLYILEGSDQYNKKILGPTIFTWYRGGLSHDVVDAGFLTTFATRAALERSFLISATPGLDE
jgi:hypothetical protein